MKKKLLSLLLVGILSVMSVGCTSNTNTKTDAKKRE